MKALDRPVTLVPTPPSLERLRRLLSLEGPERLDTDQLLALLLARATEDPSAVGIARRLLEASGGLPRLLDYRAEALGDPPFSLAPVPVARLLAGLELGRRIFLEKSRVPERRFLDAERVVAWARPRIGSLSHEEVWVLCVDGRSSLRSAWLVGKGGVHGCGLLPRDLLGPVVRDGASGFILVHNHPSGDPTPSPEDIDLTGAVLRVSTWLGTPLLDHVIVARDRSVSFRAEGLLSALSE